MALPKLQTPTYELKLPSSNAVVKFRPFLVKEEKILMMAQEAGDTNSMMNGVKQIIENCIISPSDMKMDTMPMFDLEFIFLKLRSKSVGENVKVGLVCDDCDATTQVDINLDEVGIDKPKDHDPKIMLNDQIGITMKYPRVDTMEGIGEVGGIEEGFNVIKRCVETIFTTDGEVHELRDATEKEADEFFESLTSDQFQKIRDFFESMPKLSHEVKFKCTGCEKENVRTLEGMASFFG
tara:strand:+ start:268 stop:978 length:711 start_codon:yes stop_codon:yes gene_type:complete